MIPRECLTGLTGLTYLLSTTHSRRQREGERGRAWGARDHTMGVGARGAVWEMGGAGRPG